MLEHVDLIRERKTNLGKIVSKIIIIEREDSLQRIAMMSQPEREAFIRKLAKKLQKDRGLKDDEVYNNVPSSSFTNTNNPLPDLFTSSSTTGDWYFYNASLKSKGYSDFRSRWGKRSNTDNWRRSGATSGNIITDRNVPVVTRNDNGDVDAPPTTTPNGELNDELTSPAVTDISFDGMMNNLPLTEEKLKISNSLLSHAMFELG
jgi:hypothetical protein